MNETHFFRIPAIKAFNYFLEEPWKLPCYKAHFTEPWCTL